MCSPVCNNCLNVAADFLHFVTSNDHLMACTCASVAHFLPFSQVKLVFLFSLWVTWNICLIIYSSVTNFLFFLLSWDYKISILETDILNFFSKNLCYKTRVLIVFLKTIYVISIWSYMTSFVLWPENQSAIVV